jgi:hypothetical protein
MRCSRFIDQLGATGPGFRVMKPKKAPPGCVVANNSSSTPSRRERFSLPWSNFPPSLNADVETYLRRATLNPSDSHFIRVQCPTTIEIRRWQLRYFATAIAKSGIPADTLVDLRALLDPQVAAHGLKFLLDRNDGALSTQIYNLALFLGTLADRLQMSHDEIIRLRRMARKLRAVPSVSSRRKLVDASTACC